MSTDPGKLWIVGIGPGGLEQMTREAVDLIESADLVVGYKTYLELLAPLLEGKESWSSGMRRERERVEHAIAAARKGDRVCLVSSGDPGVYGLAGLALEMLREDPVPVEIVPGVTAATAASARVGAPLTHDFAVVSLSDLLTDLALIEKRIEHAALADFVIVLYNPRSRTRTEPFDRALAILALHRAAGTPVAVVTGAYRRDEERVICRLDELGDHREDIGMTTTVIVGNSQTSVLNGLMVTPRGYTL